ncbi:LysM peptidoglycan-binding domain-containing protein [Thermanaerosceptrum fracticalcis]|uniref:LysM peptidoglycan-binding domain-containing protein n=1 Tax=Thermanaerosceptrum fracticalcis TaxID=1712410 RepID=A0A7G6E3S0_THEFR|nr:LysM domain-containing protein [Thermanaerosceptrum fracticalcis]QNB46724.1 LysM peptidoglycan-binding domain-containing protein [Thermanaerosceptrum fracticalcis]
MPTRQLPPCASGRYWRVKRGDTLYLIAIKSGITVTTLRQLNPNVDPNNLRVGSLICLPPEQPCPSGIYWEVAAGDTLYSIARATNTTVKKLLELNPNIEPNNLQIGQNICLPG